MRTDHSRQSKQNGPDEPILEPFEVIGVCSTYELGHMAGLKNAFFVKSLRMELRQLAHDLLEDHLRQSNAVRNN